jgi:hypothetical protein
VGTLKVAATVVLPGLGGFLITASGILLAAGSIYGVKTGLGAFSATLPALATVAPGALVLVEDVDNNAGTNNFTVDAMAGDAISYHGSVSSSYVMRVSNTFAAFTADSAVAPYAVASSWVAISYGM